MDWLEEKVEKRIREEHLLSEKERILVCVSGGADSVCLLAILCALAEKYSLRLAVGHVHHGLRRAADDDEAFVKDLADARGLPCYTEHVDVPALRKVWKCSVEEAARRARYEALAAVAEGIGADRLAVAHHMEDQAETVLLNLFRGTGLKGIAGMEAEKPPAKLENGRSLQTVIRPLLGITREEIEDYLKRKGLAHIEDESNAEDRYARNCIRHHILPVVREKINTGAVDHLAQVSEYAREALDFIGRETDERMRRILLEDGTVDVRRLSAETPFMRKQLLMTLLQRAGLQRGITAAHVSALEGLVSTFSGMKRIDLPGGYFAERTYDRLVILQDDISPGQQDREIPVDLPEPGTPTDIFLPGTGTVEISMLTLAEMPRPEEIPGDPYTKWFDCDKIIQPVVFRRRRPGDTIHVGTGRKPLAREMLDQKIPAAERGSYWLFAQGSEILWIVGNRRSQACLVDGTSERILKCRWTAEKQQKS